MQIDPELVSALNKIDFLRRYKELSMEFRFDSKENFEKYSNEMVSAIISSFGMNPKYDKKENFFKIIEYHGEYSFQFNLSFKFGYVTCIWDIKKKAERIGGGPWGVIGQLLSGNYYDLVPTPAFRNYDELKIILNRSFLIFKNFKDEVLRSSAENNSY
ncbi:MAG: hypothetical protein ABWZ25_03150 [Chitinophagaceae bacterium]